MKRDEAISRLKQHVTDFDYEKGKLGLFELMDVKEYAANILGRKADIMTRDSLHKTLRQQIEQTAVRVF